jgi:hypothetical protein
MAEGDFEKKERLRLEAELEAIRDASNSLGNFMFAKIQAGELTEDQAHSIDKLFIRIVIREAGIRYLKPESTSINVARQAYHLMYSTLLEYLPQCKQEIDQLRQWQRDRDR